MVDPVPGEFRVTGDYFAHPSSSSFRQMLTGVVTGPGIAPTPGEHLDDESGRRIGHDVLPILVDRADPTRFLILWDEIPKPDFQAQARIQAEQEAARLRTDTPPMPMPMPGQPQLPPWMQHGAPPPASEQVYVMDGTTGPVPDWAREMIADVTTRGPADITGAQVIDLTAGHLTAADAARLAATGEPAQAVLTPAHLAAAYGVEVTITADAAGRPLIFPIRRALPI